MDDSKQVLETQRGKLLQYVQACLGESRRNEKEPRKEQNQKNWRYFYGDIDWSHKRDEDPKVHLHKFGIAAERIRCKFKQNLINYDRWTGIERRYTIKDALLTDYAAKNLLFSQYEKADTKTVLADAILAGSIESRICIKVAGKYVQSPTGGKKRTWQLSHAVVPFSRFYVDTFEREEPLFEIEEFRTDYFRVLGMASEEQENEKPYRLEAVKRLDAFAERVDEADEKESEGNTQKTDQHKYRKPILIQLFFGTVLEENGEVMKWGAEELELRNVFFVVANEKEILVDPIKNWRWSGYSPYIYADLLRAPGKGRRAILDAGVDLNRAQDELFNLILTGGLKAVHNVTWYRKAWFADKRQATGGIKDGDQIAVSDDAPPNAEPMGTVKTGEIPPEAFNLYQTVDRAFAENVFSNLIDLSGNLPGKQVRATELVQADTAISDVFDAIAADLEELIIVRLAEESLLEIVEHLDDMDRDEVVACWGQDAGDLAEQFLALSKSERRRQVVGAFYYFGKGLRGLIANAAKSQALVNLVNTMTANPITFQAVESQISAARLLLKIAKGHGIDVEEIQPDPQERQLIDQKQLIREQAVAAGELLGQGGGGAGGGQPGMRQGTPPAVSQPGGPQQGTR